MIEAQGLWALVEARAQATPDALFAVDERDRSLSFGAYRDAAERCAAALVARGVGAGTPVTWMLPTRLETTVLVAALARIGALQNPVLPIYRSRELGFIARQLAPRLLVVPGRWRGFDYPGLAREIAAECAELDVLVLDGALPEADPLGLPPGPEPVPAEEAPVRWVFYTSGTTADPKGALHHDPGLVAAADAMCRSLALAADDRVGLVFPFTHVGGIVWLLSGLRVGCAQILVESFDPATSPGVLARHGVTQGTAGTVFHQAYLAAQRARGQERLFPRARSFPGGGAPKPPRLHHDVKRELGGAGIVSGYGLTECPIVSMNVVGDSDARLAATEGRPCQGMEVRVVRPDAAAGEAGVAVAAGEEGELRLRGPQLFQGYLDHALDAEAFDAEGFFRSGDLGRLDAEGYLVVTGRLKDVIIRKGENISAKEVEDLLHEHPALAEAAVIGLPDAVRGERCCAVVVPRAPQPAPDLESLAGFLRERGLAAQKLPEQLELLDALPRNAAGKVLKHELRARFAEPDAG